MTDELLNKAIKLRQEIKVLTDVIDGPFMDETIPLTIRGEEKNILKAVEIANKEIALVLYEILEKKEKEYDELKTD